MCVLFKHTVSRRFMNPKYNSVRVLRSVTSASNMSNSFGFALQQNITAHIRKHIWSNNVLLVNERITFLELQTWSESKLVGEDESKNV